MNHETHAGGTPSVSTECIGAVTCITLNRPEVRNAVDSDTAEALHAAFLAFEDDAQARVAVLHGAHGHFCAGWDLQFGARMAQSGQTQALMQHDFDAQAPDVHRARAPMGPTRLMLSKPVIAAISGAAVAGGMELALWCDLRVMEEDAYFGVFCRRFGVPLIDGGTVRLPRLIGMSRALDLILTGRAVHAEEALRIGLANRLAPRGQALEQALALAQQLAAFPQQTLRADRAQVYRQWGQALGQALQTEWEQGRQCIAEGLQGAVRFAQGQGRHGQMD